MQCLSKLITGNKIIHFYANIYSIYNDISGEYRKMCETEKNETAFLNYNILNLD